MLRDHKGKEGAVQMPRQEPDYRGLVFIAVNAAVLVAAFLLTRVL